MTPDRGGVVSTGPTLTSWLEWPVGFPGASDSRVHLQCQRPRFNPWMASRIATGISWSPLSGLKGVKPPVEFGERTQDCSPGKDFSVVSEAEVDVILEFSCFFYDPADVGNLISGSSAFSKSSLNIWKFMVHILLKPGLENFEHYFTSV